MIGFDSLKTLEIYIHKLLFHFTYIKIGALLIMTRCVLDDTQSQLAVAVEKERMAQDQLIDLNSKVTSLETQNSRLRQEKSHSTAQLEVLKNKMEVSEETKEKYVTS